jgi:predicted nuclease of predicted toxin-antitoxin system
VRLYSDENFPLEIVRQLRQMKYDVLTSYEAGQANQGIPDDEVLAFATQEKRVLVTLNRDDFIALHRTGISHTGIIISKDDRDYLGQTQILHSCISENPDFINRLIRIKKNNQPKSGIQIFIYQEYKR